MESNRFLEGSYPLLRTPSCSHPVCNPCCLTTIARNHTRTAYHKETRGMVEPTKSASKD